MNALCEVCPAPTGWRYTLDFQTLYSHVGKNSFCDCRSIEMASQAAGLSATFQHHVRDIQRLMESCDAAGLGHLEYRAESLLRNVCRATNILGAEIEPLLTDCRSLVSAARARTETEYHAGFSVDRGNSVAATTP